MNEREQLFARAKELGLSPAPNTGDDKLKAKIAEAEAEAQAKAKAEAEVKARAEAEAKAKAKAKAKAEAEANAAPASETSSALAASLQTLSAKAVPPVIQDAQKESLVVVKGPEQGRWRIGKKFTREAVEIPLADLSEEELAALEADPELIVSFR
ncbi:hypothetical protein [Leisingera sp. M658]|uniref:hypothetical protein n=1 Tax=Leisingera sp. M658 TaxID=2867015 RepID=UPI0021A6FF09|nr:hypothetical protein [Leisingera sp. M658]UWQ76826.1 hypothetical protein K3724_10510 [Leisingera sp. M658]